MCEAYQYITREEENAEKQNVLLISQYFLLSQRKMPSISATLICHQYIISMSKFKTLGSIET